MKRRVLTLMLALVLVLSMFPVTAFAASDMTASDSCIDLIKHFEGFREKPYWDYSQYTVGYGTRCPDDMLEEYLERGITVEEAEALLQEELESFEATLNKFIDKYDLKWTQAQFDAMVSFTYNVGGNWTTGASTHLLTQYVVAGKTGNDFLFAFAQWSNAGGEMNLGLVKRRLIEANLYLNGSYSTKVPENYDYVTFNHTDCIYEGKARSIKLQGYDSDLTDVVRPVAQKEGYRFLGWYTASKGGEWITTLTASHAGKTLYAHWQRDEGNVDEDGNILGITAAYTRTAAEALKIYAQPSASSKSTGSIATGTAMSIVADYVDADGVKWGKLSQGGWVCLGDVAPEVPETPVTPETPETPSEEEVIATGTVKLTDGTLNIRAGAGTSYDKVGTLANGARVEIYEIKNGWARISKGWISMDYVVLDGEEEETPEQTQPTEPETKPEESKPTEPAKKETVIAAGTVNISSGSLNIRKGAGTSYAKVGTIANSARVQLYEIKTVSGVKWGRTAKGWINLDYVKAATTGLITYNNLNIRSGAGTSYSVLGTYKKAEIVFIYRTVKVGTQTWGRTEKGWINVSYVKFATTGTVTYDNLNIRSAAGTDNTLVGTYKKGTEVYVYRTTKVGTQTWGRTNLGWVNMKYVKLADSGSTGSTGTTTTVYRIGVVNTTSGLNVRKGAGTGYAKVGSVEPGDKLKFTTMKLVDGTPWGKISTGWVCLDYVKLSKPASGAPALIMGDGLNVRKGAGTGYAVLGQYNKGVVVKILETKIVSGTTWGRTNKGWISMDFVL